jgi:Tfp pilus assembly protein PilV
LIEVLIALMIFSFGFASLMELFSKGLQSITRSKDVSRAVWIARAEMESGLLHPTPGETVGSTEDGYRWTRVVENADLPDQTEESDEDIIKIYRIKVQVAPPRERSTMFELETLKVVSLDESEQASP